MRRFSDPFHGSLGFLALSVLVCVHGSDALAAEPAAETVVRGDPLLSDRVHVEWFAIEEAGADAARALQAVGAVPGYYTVSELRELASKLARHWRDKGYLAASVVLPAQDVTSGGVRFTLLEGRIGDITLGASVEPSGERALGAVRSLLCGTSECSEVPIREDVLHHAMVVAGDFVGANVSARLKAGQAPGSSDLVISVESLPAWSVEGRLDNYGVQSTGRARAFTRLQLQNMIAAGSMTNLVATATEGTGSVALVLEHSQPVGVSGWRIGVQGFRGNVRLGGQFSVLDASSSGNGLSVYAHRLLKRSGTENAAFRVTLERAKLETSVLGAVSQRSYLSGQAMLLGAVDDRYLGVPAINRWQLALTHSRASGNSIAGVQGSADFLLWHAERSQWLPMGLKFDVSLRGQQANANLDTYNKMAVGGADGVRAYSSGEASGDSGWISRIDLTKHWGGAALGLQSVSMGVFYDAGGVRLTQKPAANVGANSQQRRGYGLQLEMQHSKSGSIRVYWARADGRVSAEDGKRSRVGAELKLRF